MSGGSQHNPNGRQSQLGSGWSPLQLQVANLLARAPQAHMASDRGVTWHTPTPPPHLYHVPAPSPPDPLQALKSAGGNSVFRHTATPPELYRHTPTPPDKHHMRHTPSPGDIKASAALPPDIYQHLGQARADKLRADELMAYTRVGVDLSLGGGRAANGAATSPAQPGETFFSNLFSTSTKLAAAEIRQLVGVSRPIREKRKPERTVRWTAARLRPPAAGSSPPAAPAPAPSPPPRACRRHPAHPPPPPRRRENG
uniref:Uncharacterized protein n=1 Tax=Heliothis virescens TaxID=7102 RepID=A0A2A4J4N5_HELVI